MTSTGDPSNEPDKGKQGEAAAETQFAGGPTARPNASGWSFPAIHIRKSSANNEGAGGKADEKDDLNRRSEHEDQEYTDKNLPRNYLTGKKVAAFRTNTGFIIGLVGVPGAGKTFFLNRLKKTIVRREAAGKPDYLIEPPSDDTVIGQTVHPTYHLFQRINLDNKTANAATGREDFVIFDLPGEVLTNAINAKMRVDEAETLYDALAACDAIILVLPSDALFGSDKPATWIVAEQYRHARGERGALFARIKEQGERVAAAEAAATDDPGEHDGSHEQEELDPFHEREELEKLEKRLIYIDELIAALEKTRSSKDDLAALQKEFESDRQTLSNLIEVLTTMIARVAVLRKLDCTAAVFKKKTEADQMAAQRHTALRSHTPLLYVALSKADSILTAEAPVIPLKDGLGERDRIDARPAAAMMVGEFTILRSVAEKFRWFKFDFLTTSEGQSHRRYGAPVQLGPANTPEPITADSVNLGLKLNPDQPHYGVQALIDWLEFARGESDEYKRRQRSFLRRFLGSFTALPALEADLAVRARSPELRPTNWLGRRFQGLLRWVVKADRATVLKWRVRLTWIVTTATLALLSGVPGALYERFSGGEDAYKFTPLARYPAEVEQLRKDKAFERGLRAIAVVPWSEVPKSGKMFAVPESRGVRADYERILADIQGTQSRKLTEEEAGRFSERLDALQEAINLEDAQAGAAAGQGAVRVPVFIPYHKGVVLLRSEQFGKAAEAFAAASDLLKAARAENPVEQGRLKGVTIATQYAHGTALLQAGDIVNAKTELDAAREDVPAAKSADRPLLGGEPDAVYFRFDPARTLVPLHSAALWSDSIAAHIAGFQATPDGMTDPPLSGLFDRVAGQTAAIPDGHPLLTNFVVAGALLGKPVETLRFSPERFGGKSPPATINLALHSLNQGNPAGMWGPAKRIREAVSSGDSAALAQTLSAAKSSPAELEFVEKLTGQIVGKHLATLGEEDRDRFASAYSRYFNGAGFWQRVNDHAPFGHAVYALLVALLLIAVIWRLFHLGLRTRQALWAMALANHSAERKRERVAAL